MVLCRRKEGRKERRKEGRKEGRKERRKEGKNIITIIGEVYGNLQIGDFTLKYLLKVIDSKPGKKNCY